MKKKFSLYFLVLIIFSFLFRLALSPLGNHHDLLVNAEWGQWIYLNGAKVFYENNVWIYDWPTQLPLINLLYSANFLVYARSLKIMAEISGFIAQNNFFPGIFQHWFNFSSWWGTYYAETPFGNGFIIAMKQLPILSDVAIAFLMFLIGAKVAGRKLAFLVSGIYLLIPFSWYESALWGQYDQLMVLFVILSFFALYSARAKTGPKRLLFPTSAFFFFIAVGIKPTALFLAPFFALYFLLQKPKIVDIASSILATLLVFLLTTRAFTDENVFIYFYETIYPIVFFSGRYALATHSFNFWQFISPLGGRVTELHLLGISAFALGLVFWFLFTARAFLLVKKDNSLKSLFLALFLITAGTYLFSTAMLDRYFFPGVVLLGFLVFYYPKLILWWILVGLLFSLNLFLSWGYPFEIMWFHRFWDNQALTISLLSLAQVFLFAVCLVKLKLIKIPKLSK